MVVLKLNPELGDHEVKQNVQCLGLALLRRVLKDEGALLLCRPVVCCLYCAALTAREEGEHLTPGGMYVWPSEGAVEVQSIALVPVIDDEELFDVEVPLLQVHEHGTQGLPEHDAPCVNLEKRGHREGNLALCVAVKVGRRSHPLQRACLWDPVSNVKGRWRLAPDNSRLVGRKEKAVIFVPPKHVLTHVVAGPVVPLRRCHPEEACILDLAHEEEVAGEPTQAALVVEGLQVHCAKLLGNDHPRRG
mmetsp:Transcript_29812/g.94033  ORF Transcript_29812/g.94033 Transcript_29812/m.94033 type:complete len:247 (-) Transcript_29812:397-1137(-)